MKLFTLLVTLPVLSVAQNYSAQKMSEQGITVIHLADAARGVEVAVLPAFGNRVSEMKVHGKKYSLLPRVRPRRSEKTPNLNGVPFLAPWANRLNEEDFWANGNKYTFNMTLGNVRGPIPIHGLLMNSDLWEVGEVKADGKSAWVTSRLQFWKHPELMAQWPFAHEYEMTYRLADGTLEVKVTVTNLSTESMPIALGYHPVLPHPDVPRDEWTANIPARKIVIADSRLVATGEFKPYDLPSPLPLKGHPLDTGFTDLERDAQGRAHFSIEARGMKVETLFGPKFPAAGYLCAACARRTNQGFYLF